VIRIAARFRQGLRLGRLSRRTMYLTCGTTGGAALIHRRQDRSARASTGSPAISPHTPPGPVPVRGIHSHLDQAEDRRMPSARKGDTLSFVRSARACIGSDRAADAENFARCASESAMTRRTISIIAPMSIFSSNGCFSPAARLDSSTSALAG